MAKKIKSKTKLATIMLATLASLALTQASAAMQNGMQMNGMQMKGKDVYVCSCMKTKSCPCMTEANMKGKCACGSSAPNMKAVARDSAWAKANRLALAR